MVNDRPNKDLLQKVLGSIMVDEIFILGQASVEHMEDVRQEIKKAQEEMR
jgi:hypothetical protein